ncbi:hypothetical protein [Nibribacter koreensis]|uniref:Uncharacterized protein n=1 Tax=Nibribacter koreensis TaxID=1084519 RepID=A0ABP8FJY2_9BACT
MALILRNTNQVEFHTNLTEIVEPFKKEFASLNWLLTNQDYTLLDYPEKSLVDKLDHESDRIEFAGPELLDIIENRYIQFIWGVFCGIRGKIPNLEKNELPYADCNAEIWTEPDQFLLAESEIEIICFDGSYTIVKFLDKKLEERFKEKFTDAQLLKKSAG